MDNSKKYSVKQEIISGFMALMARKAYQDITVTDVIRTAKVARVSFYRHFRSVADVLDHIADSLSEEIIADVQQVLTGNDEQKWREFLFRYTDHFKKYQERTEHFRGENVIILSSRVNERMRKLEQNSTYGSLRDKYIVFGKAGLVSNIIVKWVSEGMEESPEQIVDYIMSFITLF